MSLDKSVSFGPDVETTAACIPKERIACRRIVTPKGMCSHLLELIPGRASRAGMDSSEKVFIR